MARYLLKFPSIVEGRHTPASVQDPAEIEVPDSYLPSRRWLPLDEGAQKALQRIGENDYQTRYARLKDDKKKAFPEELLRELEEGRKLPPLARHVAPKSEFPTPTSMSELQNGPRRRGRPSDSEPV